MDQAYRLPDYNAIDVEYDEKKNNIRSLDKQIVDFRREIEKLELWRDCIGAVDVADVKSETCEKTARLQDVVDERRKTRTGLRLLTLVPFELLILGIVVLSGTLGSSVYLTHQFASDPQPRDISFYLLRFLVGALTSLVLFIVIKAGVILALDPRSLNQSVTELNAFFLAFVGIVGGLASEQVIDNIVSVSKKWLPTVVRDQERYALPAASELSKDLAAFSQSTGYLDTLVQGWLKGDQRVPAEAQLKVALWLRKPLRELFTDLPPGAVRPAVDRPATGNQPATPGPVEPKPTPAADPQALGQPQVAAGGPQPQ